MPAAGAKAVAVQLPGDRAQGGPGHQRGSSGVLSARRNASACGGLNRTYAWAGDISRGGSAQPGRRRRAPWALVARRPGPHFGAADRFGAMPAHGTAAAVIRAAGAARGAPSAR